MDMWKRYRDLQDIGFYLPSHSRLQAVPTPETISILIESIVSCQCLSNNYASSFKMISVISLVPASLFPGEYISLVLYPLSRTLVTADSISSQAMSNPKEYLNIIPTERIVAMGLALSCPAISGALPCKIGRASCRERG